jgi:hypothetical protein
MHNNRHAESNATTPEHHLWLIHQLINTTTTQQCLFVPAS